MRLRTSKVPTVVIDCRVSGGDSARPRRAIESDTLHCIMKEPVVGFWPRRLCGLVDIWQVHLTIVRQIVVYQLSKDYRPTESAFFPILITKSLARRILVLPSLMGIFWV